MTYRYDLNNRISWNITRSGRLQNGDRLYIVSGSYSRNTMNPLEPDFSVSADRFVRMDQIGVAMDAILDEIREMFDQVKERNREYRQRTGNQAKASTNQAPAS